MCERGGGSACGKVTNSESTRMNHLTHTNGAAFAGEVRDYYLVFLSGCIICGAIEK